MPKAKTPPTKPSTRKLSDHAREVVAPKGVVSTGWPAVEKKCRELGIRFRWWQSPIGRLILAKRADGLYASTIGGTGLSIPRQVGKTFLVGAIVFALCLLRPKLTVIWTAHRVRTAEETFGKMQAFARRKRIAPFIDKVVLGSGEEEIRFTNGSRILFGARESGFGLGFDEVDVVIFDEAQRLRDMTLDDMIPATNQSRQETGALLLFMGTPPRDTDPQDGPFVRMRTEALSGEDEDTGWVEFGSDPDHEFTPLPAQLTEADWAQIAKANPSFPDDTPRASILRMRKKLGSESFDREGAGRWDKRIRKGPMPTWSSLATTSTPPPVSAIGVAIDVDRVWCAIGAAALDDDGGKPYVGAVTARGQSVSRLLLSDRVEIKSDGTVVAEGTTVVEETRKVPLVVAEVARIQRETSCMVVADKKGEVGALEPDFLFAGVDVLWLGLDEVVQACADFYDAVVAGELVHNDDAGLNDAVTAAGWRKAGGRRVWAREAGNIVELEAVTFALLGANQASEVWEAWT